MDISAARISPCTRCCCRALSCKSTSRVNKVQEGTWRSEYERPVYFVETREGFMCSWCAVVGDSLILQPHPLSPELPRSLKQPNEAEILGQVVGIAMRLDDWSAASFSRLPTRAARES